MMGDIINQDLLLVWVQRPKPQAGESANEAFETIHTASGTRLAAPHKFLGESGAFSISARTGSGGAEQAEVIFSTPGGKDHGAQRSGPRLWKRSFCASRQDRNKTVSCRDHRYLALHSRCLCLRPASASASSNFASGRSLRLRAPWPSASGRSAADAPGPPKHHEASRGERRCRRNASRPRSGNPATRGHLPADPGGGRGVGHFPWLASRRFRPRRSPGRPWSPGVPGTSLDSRLFQPPKYLGIRPGPRERPGSTKTDYLLGHGDEFDGGMGIPLKTCLAVPPGSRGQLQRRG